MSNEPMSRSEAYLLRCLARTGTDGLPAPQSRMDHLLYALAEELSNGGASAQIVELMPETQFVYNESMGQFVAETDFQFVIGRTYIVNWNGAEYICTAKFGLFDLNSDGTADMFGVFVGNGVLAGEDDNGLPFALAIIPFLYGDDGFVGAIPMDGSTEISVSIKGGEIAALYKSPYEPLVLDGRVDDSGTLTVIYGDDAEVNQAFFCGREIAVVAYGQICARYTVRACTPGGLVAGSTILYLHGGVADQLKQFIYNGDGTYVPYSD